MVIPFNCKTVKVTSPFGERTLNGVKNTHKGYDLVGVESWEVCAVADGEVIQSRIITDRNNATWQWGNYVCVKTTDGYLHYYCHLDSRNVKQGDKVKKGDKLGVMGNTGYSFGKHLHFEVRNGKTSISPETVLGIPNKTGTYKLVETTAKDRVKENVDVFVKKGWIKTPEYWYTHATDLEWLPELFDTIAKEVR